MDYFQGVVAEYLRADRSCFINTEFWIRGNEAKPNDKPHWYVDVLAIHLRQKRIYLCEVTYARRAPALMARLESWRNNWPTITKTLAEDTGLPMDWPIHPWVFTPKHIRESIEPAVRKLHEHTRFTDLEDVLPWLYRTWDRIDDEAPPAEPGHSDPNDFALM